MIFIIEYIHHLINESKMLIFAYNIERRMLVLKTYLKINVYDQDAKKQQKY